MNKLIGVVLFAVASMLAGGKVSAQSSSGSSSTSTTSCGQAGGTCSEDFTGTSASLNWTSLNDACLTAGNGSGSIPACGGTVAGYSIPASEKVKGQGALLLTPPVDDQTGAILSAFKPFPLSQGINITFTTYTFGGSHDGIAQDGADGIVFFLTDGTQAAPTTTGGEGGSMGYDCSNVNGVYDGIANGYLGLGIDEFGNFLNSNDNGSQGVWNSNVSPLPGTTAQGSNPGTGSNTYFNGSWQYQPERIGLRGAGNTNWAWLQSVNPSYYNSNNISPQSAVQTACSTGQYVTDPYGYASSPITYNYNPLPGGSAILPDKQDIANDGAQANDPNVTRNPTSATPSSDIAWPITYQLKISASGLLSFSYSFQGGTMTPVLTNFDITSANGPLPASLRFGFSAGTGGSNNTHEITCFKASPLASTSSAAANTIQSGQYKTGTQIYLASYSASPWWGSLKAIPLVVDSNGNLAASNTATWDGKCTLTGGWCDSMGTDSNGNPVTQVTAANGFVTPENRVLVTATGSDVTTSGSGVGFSMQQALTQYPSAVQTAFATAAATDSTSQISMTSQQLLGWVLGQRCSEQLFSSTQSSNGPAEYYGDCSSTTATGNLNPRTYVLGDIIDSSPLWVGAPVMGQYNNTFTDDLYGTTVSPPENQSGAQTYGAFASSDASRLNVVYVGSNDGYLHGFEAGSFGAGGAFSDPKGIGAGNNDGKEVLGYMPYNVLLDQAGQLTNPIGAHQYLVDATPGAGDLFYGENCSSGTCSGGSWHTWLVGGVGSNGREIYALDITNPAHFTTAQAASLVIGDWTNTTMPHLGNTMGAPSIVRMHNGQWAIIFGNGLNSGASAGVYIGLVDRTTGAVKFMFLDTGVGSGSIQNGIAYVTPVDLDGDGIVDYLYAGDQQGNVWRFDVTSTNPANWSVSNFPGNTASTCSNNYQGSAVAATCSPLFTATTTSGSSTLPQPITTAIVTATIQTDGASRNMLYFGTGEQTPQTGNSAALYAPASTGSSATTQQQAFYGIWDWNMAGWNALSSAQFASLSGDNSISTASSSLQPITSTTTTVSDQGQITGYRTLSAATPICWAGSSTCSSGNTQYGWMYNLPSTNEQIIYNPTIIQGAIVVNTAIPPAVSTTQCTANSQTGWTMAFDPVSGGALPQNFFSTVNSAASGVQGNAVGTSTAVIYNGQVNVMSQTAPGNVLTKPVTPTNYSGPARVSWREIRN